MERPVARLRRVRQRASAAVFGDGVGLALFLGSLVFALSLWRLEVFITDNYAVVNTLVGLSDGHLYIDRIVYGSETSPGTRIVGKRLYGRNYGQVMWLVEGAAMVADTRIVIAAGWSLMMMAFVYVAGGLIDRRRAAAYTAAVVGVATFAANVVLAEPVEPRTHYLMALSISTAVTAALCAVFCYRLVVRRYGQRVGTATGAAVMLATPVGLWAPIPKRHLMVTLLALLSVYALARSREAGTRSAARRFRAVAYFPVGLTAWVLSLEGIVLAVAVLVADLTTARWNDTRTLALVGGAALLGGVPFLATNAAISGSSLRPPFLLTPNRNASAGADAATNLKNTTWDKRRFVDTRTMLGKVLLLTRRVTKGARLALVEPARLYYTFVRSGYFAPYSGGAASRAISLTMLEAAPVLGGLLAAPVAYFQSGYDGDRTLRCMDTFAIVYAVSLTIVYLPGLPSLGAQLTVRYLLPLYVFGLYGLVRLAPVRCLLRDHLNWIAWAYATTVLIGGQLFIMAYHLNTLQVGEAVQLHALVALTVAAVVAVWTIVATNRNDDRLGAAAFGVAAGSATVFVLLGALVYYQNGTDFALGVVDLLADILSG